MDRKTRPPPTPDTAVIPAAGLGTRMRFVAPGTPKELLPVRGRPAILHALEECQLAGASMAAVILRRGKRDVRRVLEDHAPPGLELRFFDQPEPLGEADAVSRASEVLRDGPFVLIYPDNLSRPPGALATVAEAFSRTGRDCLALTRVNAENAHAYSGSGRVELEPAGGGLYRVIDFLPKERLGRFMTGGGETLRACGMSGHHPHFLEYVERARRSAGAGLEISDSMARRLMLRDGIEILGVPIFGEIIDLGNPAGYARSTS
jgi:UTP--glucose-1-phosphate uridylyltransferase